MLAAYSVLNPKCLFRGASLLEQRRRIRNTSTNALVAHVFFFRCKFEARSVAANLLVFFVDWMGGPPVSLVGLRSLDVHMCWLQCARETVAKKVKLRAARPAFLTRYHDSSLGAVSVWLAWPDLANAGWPKDVAMLTTRIAFVSIPYYAVLCTPFCLNFELSHRFSQLTAADNRRGSG